MALALSAQGVFAAQPAATRARLLNPDGFVNSGTIRLKPKPSAPSAPVPTSITVDSTLNPLNSGSITGAPISGQTGALYTIGANYGVTQGTNEFFSFSTFNVGAGDTAQFMAANNITNIISRVTGGTSTTINGTIISPASLWFINPAGVIIGQGATLNVPGGFNFGSADFIAFADQSKFYGLPSNGPVPPVLSSAAPSAFGFLDSSPGAISFDHTLPGQIPGSPTLVTSSGGTYTIPASQGVINGPSASNLNLFFSFGTFNVHTGETALFTNDSDFASSSFSNLISRVTGGTTTTINGAIDSTAFPSANFWFINPAGVTIGAGAIINVPAALAIGSADFITFADQSKFYGIPSNGPTPTVLSIAIPSAFGFLGGSQAGPFQASGWSVPSAQGNVMIVGGSEVSLTDTKITSANAPSSVTVIAGAGDVTFSGPTSINTYSFPRATANAGDITITASGAFNMLGPQVLTPGTQGIYMTGGPALTTGTYSGYNAGNITITANGVSAGDPSTTGYTPGGVGIGSFSDAAGTGGTISIDAGSTGALKLYGAFITSEAAKLYVPSTNSYPYPGGGSAGNIILKAGTISVVGSDITSSTTEKGNAGTINMTAATDLSIQSSVVASASDVSATQAATNPAPSQVIGSAGGVFLTAGRDMTLQSATIQVFADASASAIANTGANAGGIGLSAGRNVSLMDSQLDGHATMTGDSGNVIVAAGGNVLISGVPWAEFDPAVTDTVSSQSTQSGNAGHIGISAGGSITVTGANIGSDVTGSTNTNSADIVLGAASTVSVSGSSISSSSTNAGPAGSVQITGPSGVTIGALSSVNTSIVDSAQNAGTVTISSGGFVSVSNSQIASNSTNSTGNGGNVSVSGSGVLIDQQSLVSSNFNSNGNGATQGAPGSVAIFATGTTAPNDPLSSNLTAPTAGVVRIVDSAITATNSGGTGTNNNVASLGQIWIGMDLPGASATVSDNVVIAGSVVSTDVSAGGIGNNLTVAANNSVWIGASPTGGYPILAPGPPLGVNDIRTSPTQSLITSQTESSAVSGGQILIQGGNGGVTIGSTYVDANNAVNGSNSDSTFVQSNIHINVGSSSGAVHLSESFITTETSGVDPAGDISIMGDSVQISGSLVSASTKGTGSAGDIAMTASGTQIGTTLQVTGGAVITSDADQGQTSTTNAGTVALTSTAGSVQVGLSTDAIQTKISSSAGANAGTAGTVTIFAGNGIALGDANVSTTAGGTATNPSNAAPATITLTANNGSGPLSIANSKLDATTTGTQSAGTIDISGSQIAISNTDIASATKSASPAGDVKIAGATVSILGGSGGSNTTGNSITVSTTGSGDAGNITISASGADPQSGSALVIDRMNVQSTASLASGATASSGIVGNAGTITLTAAKGSVNLGDATAGAAPTEIQTSADSAAGKAGTITIISAGTLTAADTTVDTSVATNQLTDAYGTALVPGTITLTAPGAIALTGSTLKATTTGNVAAGDIQVSAGGYLTIASLGGPNGGSAITVDASATGATAGHGGALEVMSAGPVTISGIGTTLSSNSSNASVGGSVTILASSLSMSDGAVISADTSSSPITGGSPSSLSTQPTYRLKSPTGNGAPAVTGGNVLVQTTGDVALTGAGTTISANATGTGSGGTVSINSGGLSLTNGAVIATTATGAGNSGAITISLNPAPVAPGQFPPPIQITGNSQITTNADASTGGNITINAGDSPLTMRDSLINATAGANGNGGNITINDVTQTILQSSAILARAQSGNGGAININLEPGPLFPQDNFEPVSFFIKDSQSLVSADSQSGNNGTVTINAPQTNFNSALATPEVSVARTPELASNACRRDPNRSTFVREGRGGVAPAPDGYQTAPPTSQTSLAATAAATPGAKSTSKNARKLIAAAVDVGCD